jgi:hypothetical protein
MGCCGSRVAAGIATSKTTILAELLDADLLPALERIRVALAAEAGPAMRLHAYLHTDVAAILRLPYDVRGLYNGDILELPDLSDQAARRGEMHRLTTALVDQGIASGKRPPCPRPRSAPSKWPTSSCAPRSPAWHTTGKRRHQHALDHAGDHSPGGKPPPPPPHDERAAGRQELLVGLVLVGLADDHGTAGLVHRSPRPHLDGAAVPADEPDA